MAYQTLPLRNGLLGFPREGKRRAASPLSLSWQTEGGGRRAGAQGWEVTFEKDLIYNYSYLQERNLGTLVTSVTVKR